ncbi:MAG TPA: aminotransferase class III-fold pyridoxal phosphate-dependent enzyme [Stellaceae bacterium]|nr:aminotransferase class III-fold pyridoxal phosphate-dependent enzyme [Stellaceae bacterium]
MPDTRVNFDLTTALADSERRFAAANPKSEKRYKDAAGAMPGGNTRTVLHYSPFPAAFAKGEGQRVTDIDGHVYTDFLSEYSAGLYGHSHPKIMAAAQHALKDGIALGGPNAYEAELAALVKARFPSIDLIRFTNSGTESNLMALVTARAITGRSHVLVFESGYHGGVLSFRGGTNPINVPMPFVVGTYNDVEGTLALIEKHKNELAAIILEPMMGASGAIAGTREFLQALRDATAKHGIVLIFDEVMTSRLSPGGLQEAHGIRPDMTTFGKYLGGGFSFGAFGGARRLMERYDPTRKDSIAHAGTFNNNVMSMAAGVVGLKEIYTPEAARTLTATGEGLKARLNALFKEKGVAMQSTGIGSLLSIHFQTTPIRTPKDIVACEEKRALLHLELMTRGYYSARRSYLTLSIVLEKADYDGFVAAVGAIADEYKSVLKE